MSKTKRWADCPYSCPASDECLCALSTLICDRNIVTVHKPVLSSPALAAGVERCKSIQDGRKTGAGFDGSNANKHPGFFQQAHGRQNIPRSVISTRDSRTYYIILSLSVIVNFKSVYINAAFSYFPHSSLQSPELFVQNFPFPISLCAIKQPVYSNKQLVLL